METNDIAGVMPESQCFRSDSLDDVIAKAYVSHRDGILRYIHSAINNRAEAEDMAQDVFLRILDYRMLINEATIKFFMYKIARNLICDYLRRHQVRQECYDYIYYNVSSPETESADCLAITKDIASLERDIIARLSPQRRVTYRMKRFGLMTCNEIACRLKLSTRTVENHYRHACLEIRDYMKRCI